MGKLAVLQQKYAENFASLSLREQVLILITGLALIIFVIFIFFIDSNTWLPVNTVKEYERLLKVLTR